MQNKQAFEVPIMFVKTCDWVGMPLQHEYGEAKLRTHMSSFVKHLTSKKNYPTIAVRLPNQFNMFPESVLVYPHSIVVTMQPPDRLSVRDVERILRVRLGLHADNVVLKERSIEEDGPASTYIRSVAKGGPDFIVPGRVLQTAKSLGLSRYKGDPPPVNPGSDMQSGVIPSEQAYRGPELPQTNPDILEDAATMKSTYHIAPETTTDAEYARHMPALPEMNAIDSDRENADHDDTTAYLIPRTAQWQPATTRVPRRSRRNNARRVTSPRYAMAPSGGLIIDSDTDTESGPEDGANTPNATEAQRPRPRDPRERSSAAFLQVVNQQTRCNHQ